MISDRQHKFYFRLWTRAKKHLLNGRETWSKLEQDNRRHELHIRAIGCDKSHYDLTNREFDKVIAELRAIIDLSDLNAQLHQADQQRRRLFFGIRAIMRRLRLSENYVRSIVHRMNENGELGSNDLYQLGPDELHKVIVALSEHQRRVDELLPAA